MNGKIIGFSNDVKDSFKSVILVKDILLENKLNLVEIIHFSLKKISITIRFNDILKFFLVSGSYYLEKFGLEIYVKYVRNRIDEIRNNLEQNISLSKDKSHAIFNISAKIVKNIPTEVSNPRDKKTSQKSRVSNKYFSIKKYIDNNTTLVKLNKLRTRNFIIYQNNVMNLEYDRVKNELIITSVEAFSDIEFDMNKLHTTEVVIKMLFNFTNTKEELIDLLENPYGGQYKNDYIKYIDILNGNRSYNKEDLNVLISILARLLQQKHQGPIGVARPQKLNPSLVKNNTKLMGYIDNLIYTLSDFTQKHLINANDFSFLKSDRLIKDINVKKIELNPMLELSYINDHSSKIKYDMITININDVEPNHIESFFTKIVTNPLFEKTPITINNYEDVISDLLDYSNRYKNNQLPDFIILAKIKGILTYEDFDNVISIMESPDFINARGNPYYKRLANKIHSIQNKKGKYDEMLNYIQIYEEYIVEQISLYMSNKKAYKDSEYNNADISVVSDMHFNTIRDINKGNYSKNFNILAGDFYNNTFHRGGLDISESCDVKGIGVLGNHDLNWKSNIEDVKREVKTNYKTSIENLNKYFPNVKILNNEVYYHKGVAFVGVTMVTDEDENGKRTFFNNEYLGSFFAEEDYITITKQLLDSVDESTPIILITHSPFKEYSVATNKKLGIYSNNLLSTYKNLKVYIHGHGHSAPNEQYIGNIRCISNPIVNNIYGNSVCNLKWSDINKYGVMI